MILKGTIVDCFDNSGCKRIKVIQLYSNKYNKAGEGFRVVLHVFNPNRNKLIKKKHYTVACIGVKQFKHRVCDYIIGFPENAIIMLTDNCKKLLGTRVYGVMQRECCKLKKYEPTLVHKIMLLSRCVI